MGFFYRYAGPDTQVARSEWQGGSWASYLASNQGWIVAQIDGRGSGGDGDRRKFEVWQQLGSTEVQDQIEVHYQGIQVQLALHLFKLFCHCIYVSCCRSQNI